MEKKLETSNFFFSHNIFCPFSKQIAPLKPHWNCCLQMLLVLTSLLPNDEILYLSKFKAFADDKIILSQKLKFVSRRVENIVRNGENAGYQHFLLFPQCFQKLFFPEMLKVGIVW